MTDPILQEKDLIGGRYRIDSFLNQGGMQEVYVAHDTRLKREIVSVVLFPAGGLLA